MDAGPLRDVLTLVAGGATGVLSAAFGVGGAVISTPAIRLLGASASAAVGTTLPAVLPSAATGTARYAREGLIDWRVVTWTAPAGIVASVGGSLLSDVIPGDGHWLMVLTAALLGFTAWRMTQPSPSAPEPEADIEMVPHVPADSARRDSALVLVAIGAAAGLMSGLLGVGGGVVMVPAFIEIARIPLKAAIATSLACVGVFAVPGTITHAALGGVDWRFAAWLSVGVVPGARLGAVLAIRAGDRRLRRAVALFLGVVAVIYAAGELVALVR
jgi:uncharacterized membrane protein YfcA